MLTPPLCTCGVPIGHLSELIREARAKIFAQELERTGTAPDRAIFDPEIRVDLGPTLDALRVHCECARGALMTTRDMRDDP
jgi:hypothetical protein